MSEKIRARVRRIEDFLAANPFSMTLLIRLLRAAAVAPDRFGELLAGVLAPILLGGGLMVAKDARISGAAK